MADLQHHAAAGYRVADGEEDVLGGVGHGHFHRHGDGIDDRAGRRDHEEHEEQREPLGLDGSAAAHGEQDAGQQPEQRANLEQEDFLRATDGVERQADDEDRPPGGRGRLALATLPHRGPVAPDQPARDAEHDGAVRLLVGAPDAAKEIDEAGGEEEGQAGHDRAPREERGGQVGGGGTGMDHGLGAPGPMPSSSSTARCRKAAISSLPGNST